LKVAVPGPGEDLHPITFEHDQGDAHASNADFPRSTQDRVHAICVGKGSVPVPPALQGIDTQADPVRGDQTAVQKASQLVHGFPRGLDSGLQNGSAQARDGHLQSRRDLPFMKGMQEGEEQAVLVKTQG
jgi:hypothetical protein